MEWIPKISIYIVDDCRYKHGAYMYIYILYKMASNWWVYNEQSWSHKVIISPHIVCLVYLAAKIQLFILSR